MPTIMPTYMRVINGLRRKSLWASSRAT